MSQREKREDKRGQLPLFKEERHQAQYSKTGGVRTSPKITCLSCEREGHTARFCPSRVSQKRESSRTAQGNTVTAAKPNRNRDFPVLTVKISVPVEATTIVAELFTTWAKIDHQNIRGIIDSGAQISIIREGFTHGVPRDGDGHIDNDRRLEMAPLRIEC
ncbi:retrovirus-related Pol polyprotein from transposon 297 [Nephila pilipes]|uniref:Retrovirus-related Pol polyprotein from transposon 297 n=1 Tax=Nephila pilipes TaxID=299642 RepID=A0A8X6PCX4_NEPPI|nr:retrovirus-related Pol polyprotein from transposon 297 [Nephila pilipes]